MFLRRPVFILAIAMACLGGMPEATPGPTGKLLSPGESPRTLSDSPVMLLAADTLIILEPVRITGTRYQLAGAGYSQQTIDSLERDKHIFDGLDRLLAKHSGMYIRSYGPGVLASLSMRGGSTNQTKLLWNGISLRSSMNGQNDLSLLPVFFFDKISVQYGGGSALWGGGALGGTIFLDNNPSAEKGFTVYAGLQGEERGGISQQAKIGWQGRGAGTSLRVFNLHSQNRYRYVNTSLPSRPVQIQEHAAYQARGLLSETNLRLGQRHTLGINLWLQSADRNIPPALQQTHGGANQLDAATRLNANWQAWFGKAVFTWRGAWFDETLTYGDSLNAESVSRWKTLTQEAEARWQVTSLLMVNTGIRLQSANATADNYPRGAERNLLALFSSIGWKTQDEKLELQINGRQEFGNNLEIPFVPSVGLAWRAGRDWILKANAGKNFRLPSLNDMYWSPGGNPDLKPESGWSQDLTIAWGEQLPGPSDDKKLNASLSGFHRLITDWIIWLPSGGGMLWQPQNIMEVRSYGLEARLAGSLSYAGITLDWRAGWDHTVSVNRKGKSPNDASVGKQLIHVPKNRGTFGIRLTWGDMGIFYDHQHTGRAFTSSDNSQWLQPWHHGDIGMDYTFLLCGYEANAYANVVNLWNSAYVVMPGRPMPLRYFRLGVLINLQW
ncbi:MAG: TonB-dependent receptor [Bacteroidales bacterium]